MRFVLAVLLFFSARGALRGTDKDRSAAAEVPHPPAERLAAATQASTDGKEGDGGPILCSAEEMARLGVDLKLTTDETQKLSGALLQASEKPCRRSRVEPMYLGAPDLDGIKPVKKFALGLGKDPEEVDGAEGAAPEPLPSLQLPRHPGRKHVDPTVKYTDASEERYNKEAMDAEVPDWREKIEETKTNFYCYLWRNHFRMQDKLEEENVCFAEDLEKKYKKAPTCALLTHDGDFQDLGRRLFKAGGKKSALQEEIDGHDVVVRFSDHWNNQGAYGHKTSYRVYSRIGDGLQDWQYNNMFGKKETTAGCMNVTDGYIVLWNQNLNDCKNRLEIGAWLKHQASLSGVPIYTYTPEDLKFLVAHFYDFVQQDPFLKGCLWNAYEHKDELCYKAFKHRFPISTKEGASYITPSTGFGGALAFLASCSQVTLYGYSSYAMPGPGRNGDIQVHMPSLAEQTLMLKILPERIDKLEIRPEGAARLNMSTATGYLKDHARLQFFNYTLIHQLKGVPGFFAGRDPAEVCKGRQVPDPDWEVKEGIPPSYGYWGH